MKKYSLMVNIDGKEHEVTLTDAQLIEAYKTEQYNIDTELMRSTIDELSREGCISEDDAERFKDPETLDYLVKEYREDMDSGDWLMEDLVQFSGEVVMRYKSDDDAEV